MISLQLQRGTIHEGSALELKRKDPRNPAGGDLCGIFAVETAKGGFAAGIGRKDYRRLPFLVDEPVQLVVGPFGIER